MKGNHTFSLIIAFVLWPFPGNLHERCPLICSLEHRGMGWGNLDFFGSKTNLGKSNFSRNPRSLHVCVCVRVFFFFLQREIFSILN